MTERIGFLTCNLVRFLRERVYIEFTVAEIDSSRVIIDTLEGSNQVGKNRCRLSKR